MADNYIANPGVGGDEFAADDIAGIKFARMKLTLGADGVNAGDVSSGNPMPVTGPLTDAQLRAAAVPVLGSGTFTVAGTVTANAGSGTMAVSGPLTDAELRASAVPVSGTFFQATQPVSGTVTANAGTGTMAVSAAALPLPAGASTETTLAAVNTKTPALGAATVANSSPVNIASDQVVNVTSPDLIITGQGSQTAINNNIVLAAAGTAATDASTYRTVAIQVVPAAGTVTAGTVAFEASNDNVNFVAVSLYDTASLTANPVTSYTVAAATTRYFRGPVSFRFFRARLSVGITGTTTGVQAFSRFSPDTFYSPQQTVTQATAANLACTATIASGTVTTVSTLSAITAGANLIADVGQQYRANATGAGTPTNLLSPATPAVQTIKGSAGRLLAIFLVNSNAAARYLKVFNIVSPTLGTSSATLDIAIPPNSAQAVFISLEGGMAFATAITVSITGARGVTDNTAITLNDVTGFTVHA